VRLSGYNRAVFQRPLIVAFALVPVLALASQAATNFQDIPAGHWARRAASVLADHQIMPGRTPVDFAGESPLSRYELAGTLSHLYFIEGPPATFVVLTDMPAGHVGTLEVQRVMGFGLMPARKRGHFEGSSSASRKEIILALDTLFEKNGVDPPARKTSVVFPDVPSNSPIGKAVDRMVNRFGLMDAQSGTRFEQEESLSRYQFLSMLMRAMRYLQPTIAKELIEPAVVVKPSLFPGETPVPDASGAPLASAAPQALPSGQVLHSRAWLKGEVLAIYSEDLPTDPGLVSNGEQRQFSGNGLPGGGLFAEYWNGSWGGALDLSSYLIGFTVPNTAKNAGGTVDINMLETVAQIEGLYQLPLTPNAQLGFGLVGAYRYARDLSTIGSTYLTADKTYFGAGPAVVFGYRLSPAFALSGGLDAYPVLQTYALNNAASGSKSITRWVAYPRVRLEYGFAGNWLATVGMSALLSGGGGGMQTLIGGSLGIGTGF
jgi:hypothetical protein